MSAGRKIRGSRDARACLEAVRSSGVSRGEWARAHGIDGRSLHAWERNLARRGQVVEPSPRIVELVPAPVSRPAARYVLRVGVFAIELDGDFDEAVVVRLVRALGAC